MSMFHDRIPLSQFYLGFGGQKSKLFQNFNAPNTWTPMSHSSTIENQRETVQNYSKIKNVEYTTFCMYLKNPQKIQ